MLPNSRVREPTATTYHGCSMPRRPNEERRTQAALYGEYLREGSDRTGLKVATIARQAGIREVQLQRMARGEGGPPASPDIQAKISEILGADFNPQTGDDVKATDVQGGAAEPATNTARARERVIEAAKRDISAICGVRLSQVRISIDF